MKSIEQFKQKQSDMTDEDLIKLVEDEISHMAQSGGRSHTMSVPPKITDTDMLLFEMLRRFKSLITNKTK